MDTGTRLEQYEIVEKIGEGGMGAVYRAEDTRLKRAVAVKVLPPELALDEERLGRLEREAQLLASLNHPNVATVHGFGDVTIAEDGAERRVAFVVMELVEGTSLYDRLAGGALPWREAVDIAAGIAAGLEAAHERGIVHRDLKPANVHLTPDGNVKVLDFGLAKAWEPDGAASGSLELSASPTIAGATRTGMIMGTAAYMSPEQARGKPVDKRADIWALGCVLFEMLVGAKTFDGETVSDVLAAILKEAYDPERLPPIPPRLRQVLDRCLEKDPARRMRDVADVRIELEEAKGDKVGPGTAAGAAGLSWQLAVGLATAAIAVGLALGWVTWGGAPPAPERHVILSAESVADGPSGVAISPDASLVAETAVAGGIRVRPDDQIEWRELQDTQGAMALVFDAAGERIYFSRFNEVLSVGVDGSSPMVAASLEDVAWIPGVFRGLDGSVQAGVWHRDQSLRIIGIGSEGGYADLWSGDNSVRAIVTSQLAEDKWLGWLYTGGTSQGVAVIDGSTGEVTVALDNYRSPHHLGGGRVLAVDDRGRLAMAHMDPNSGEVTRAPIVRVEGLGFAIGAAAAYGVAADNSLAYVAGEQGTGGQVLAWLDRDGDTEVFSERRGSHNTDTRVSPDGTMIALELDPADEQEHISVWIHDVARDVRSALTPGVRTTFPLWSPDGRELVVLARDGVDVTGMYRIPVDRSAGLDLVLAAAEERNVLPQDWSPDGTQIVYVDSATPNRARAPDNDIRLVPANGGDPVDFLATNASEVDPRFSPDGRWIAYASDHSGEYQVYIRPAAGGGETRISAEGGRSPQWAPGGDELFFRRGNRNLLVVDIALGERPVVSPERDLVRLPPGARVQLAAGAHDGQRFLISLSGGSDAPKALHAIYGWRPEGSQ